MKNALYLALDFPNWSESEQFLKENKLSGIPVKVGMELFYREGPALIEKLKENQHPIFLDLKLHDIPTTVRRAMKNLAKLEVDIVNVHALGGGEMIAEAKEGLLHGGANQTKLVAVTILTSMNNQTMNQELRIPGQLEEQVINLAKLSKDNGADGVVCSVHEVKGIKQACGEGFLTVTPGIRLENTSSNDQQRIASPAFAKQSGSDILVIGRSITKAENPRAAYELAIKEINTYGN